MIIWYLKETDGAESEKGGIVKDCREFAILRKENDPHSITAPSMIGENL